MALLVLKRPTVSRTAKAHMVMDCSEDEYDVLQ